MPSAWRLPTVLPSVGRISGQPVADRSVADLSLPDIAVPELPAVQRLSSSSEREDLFPQPRYAEKFRCLGPECEDSCCKAWDLRLDRATYERYQLIPVESLLGRKVQSSVEMLPEPREERAYGRILLNENLECPFLTEEKWCGIQQTMGEAALSQTCRTYPRIEQQAPGGRWETTMHLSCPEAARLILLDQEAAQQEWVAHGADGRSMVAAYEAVAEWGLHSMTAAKGTEIPEAILDATRRLLLLLLRDRRYSLGERVWLMGVFAGRLRTAMPGIELESAQRFPALLREFSGLLGAGTLRPVLARLAGRPAMQLDLTLGLVNRRLERVINSLRFLDAVKEFLDGIGYRPGMTPESLAPTLSRAEAEFFVPWMEAHPWLLENYLAHALYRSSFPFGKDWKQADVEGEFFGLCTHFVSIRTLMMGVSGAHGAGFRAEHAVHLVQTYSRMMDHHADFLHLAAGMLVGANQRDAGSLAGLLLEGVRRDGCAGMAAGAMA